MSRNCSRSSWLSSACDRLSLDRLLSSKFIVAFKSQHSSTEFLTIVDWSSRANAFLAVIENSSSISHTHWTVLTPVVSFLRARCQHFEHFLRSWCPNSRVYKDQLLCSRCPNSRAHKDRLLASMMPKFTYLASVRYVCGFTVFANFAVVTIWAIFAGFLGNFCAFAVPSRMSTQFPSGNFSPQMWSFLRTAMFESNLAQFQSLSKCRSRVEHVFERMKMKPSNWKNLC